MVETALPLLGAQVRSLTGGLRSHMPRGVAEEERADRKS